MRPNTSESGIFSTKRNRPVSTSMLTRMLVPKPKKAFQSPGVQSFGLDVAVVAHVPLPVMRCMRKRPVGRARAPSSTLVRIATTQPKMPPCALIIAQAHLVELREIGGAAVAEHDAAVAAVVGLAHGGVDAHLGGDAARPAGSRCRGCAASARGRSGRTRPCRACRSPARRRAG